MPTNNNINKRMADEDKCGIIPTNYSSSSRSYGRRNNDLFMFESSVKVWAEVCVVPRAHILIVPQLQY